MTPRPPPTGLVVGSGDQAPGVLSLDDHVAGLEEGAHISALVTWTVIPTILTHGVTANPRERGAAEAGASLHPPDGHAPSRHREV